MGTDCFNTEALSFPDVGNDYFTSGVHVSDKFVT